MLTGAIFCDSDNFVARSIKDITHEAESHVALLFGDIVLHFRFLGFESMHIDEFKSLYHIGTTLEAPQAVLVSPEAVIQQYKGKAYDFFGMIYVGFFLLFRDLFGLNLPGGNQFEARRDRFCVEFAAEICTGERGSMMTPGQFKNKLLAKGWKPCKISESFTTL
jgi:hypothetical protein